jgi:hypothetical protein
MSLFHKNGPKSHSVCYIWEVTMKIWKSPLWIWGPNCSNHEKSVIFWVVRWCSSKTTWCFREPYHLNLQNQRVSQERNHDNYHTSWMTWNCQLHLLGSFLVYFSNPEYSGYILFETLDSPRTKWLYNPEDYSSLEPQLTQWDCSFLIQRNTSQLGLFLQIFACINIWQKHNFTPTTRH